MLEGKTKNKGVSCVLVISITITACAFSTGAMGIGTDGPMIAGWQIGAMCIFGPLALFSFVVWLSGNEDNGGGGKGKDKPDQPPPGGRRRSVETKDDHSWHDPTTQEFQEPGTVWQYGGTHAQRSAPAEPAPEVQPVIQPEAFPDTVVHEEWGHFVPETERVEVPWLN